MTRPPAAVGIVLASIASLLLGCASLGPVPAANNVATAELRNAQGQPVGTATFTEVGDGIRVVLDMRGMPPGTKAVHIHETGRCEPPDFAAAGAHLNPDDRRDGLRNPAGPTPVTCPTSPSGTTARDDWSR